MNIRISEWVGDRATDVEQGDKICLKIKEAFANGEDVVVDFSGMKTILSIFTNNAIGALYEDYNSEYLNSHLKIINMGDDDLFLLGRVIERAKDFYANREAVTEVLDEVLGE